MRALPLRAANASPMRYTRANRLPTPQVQKALVRQVVNLRPQGNTITVTTREQNPFAASRPISVVTQASGGMARPDPQQQSRRLLHEYIPGLGADVPAAVPVKQPGALDFLTTAAGTAADLYAQRQQTMAAQAQANAAIAQARSDALRAQLANPFTAMQQRSSITIPLLIVAGGAALVAGVLILRKRKARR